MEIMKRVYPSTFKLKAPKINYKGMIRRNNEKECEDSEMRMVVRNKFGL